MEKQNDGCKSCTDNQQIKNTQRLVIIGGSIFFFFGLYGIISFIKHILSIF
jgi:hypothetical protein